jgi:PAS domain S-box-containing protein
MTEPIPAAEPRVLGQLLAAHSAFSVFSDKQKIAEFIQRTVEAVPGVSSCGLCLRGGVRPRMGAADIHECDVCAIYRAEIGSGKAGQCPLSNQTGMCVIPLQTQDEHYGFLVLKLEVDKPFAAYAPFVDNLANSLALNAERRWQKQRLEAANSELLTLRDHLQDLVAKRTDELRGANDRLQHLNAVLRSIRGVNQIIVREGNVERLVQTVCECLIETRCYSNAWIALAEPAGELIARGMAGTDEAYIGSVKRLGPANDLHCIATALKQPGVVTVADPRAACSGCSLSQQKGPGRSAMVVRLEHRGRVFGVLVVSADPHFAADEEEHALLVEVAEDIGLALQSIEQENGRKRADHDLKASETRYRCLFESAKDGILILDADTGKIVDVNPFLMELTGYSHQDFLDQHLWEIGPFKDVAASKISFAELQAKEYVRYEDLPLKTKDGRQIDVEFVSNVYRVDNQKVIQCNIRDITARKQVEEELRVKDRALESSINAIALSGLDGKLTYVNPAFLKLWGYRDRREVKGRSAIEFWVSPDEAAQVMAALQKTGQWSGEMKAANKDGGAIDLELTACVILGVDGGPTGMFAAFHDITERKLANEARRESEERYSALFRGAAEGILVADLETKMFTYANPAICRMLGYSEEELRRLGVQDIHPAESMEHVIGEFQAQARGEKALAPELPCQRKDGSVIYADITASGMVLNKKHYNVGFFSDVTDRKLAKQEREKLEEQIRASQKMEAIGGLAGGVAHDFNNLLSVILSYTGFAMGAVKDGDPLKDDLLEVKKAADRAVALTRQLLAFSRKQVLQPVALDLNQISTGVEKMLRRILGEDIDLVQTLAPDLGLTLADPGQLEQVLMNLVVNARDAMPEGGKLTIETSNVEIDEEYAARHVAVTPGSYVQIAVTDTGSGMDEQTRARIFEPFFTTKPKGKGTGLGLSTVYGIVKQSGGNVWVYSELGQGTTFKVYLPRELSATTATAIKPSAIPRRVTGTETILVVEDEEALRKVAKRSLEAAGYRVLTAAAGDDALLVSAQHAGDIQLLLTDVVMPRMSGRVLAQELAKTRPTLKIVYMSGYTDNAIVHHGVLDAGTHFLAKPFTSAALTEKVREVLDEGTTRVAGEREPAAKDDAEVKKQPLDKDALRGLPEELLGKLRRAVTAARYDEIALLIETIRLTEPEVAAGLRRMADLFDYDGLRALLGPGKEE